MRVLKRADSGDRIRHPRRGRARMSDRRYKELGTGSFFGELLYERAVPEGHFLRQLEGLVDWTAFTDQLVRLYRGKGRVGRPPYDPAVILKMLLLAYLYQLSERATERYVNDSLSAKWFLGLAADEAAPDHSTLTAFKRRIVERGGEASLQGMMREITRQALAAGVEFGTIQVVDSTHTIADVNVGKDDRRRKKEGKGPRDGGAAWGVKGKKRVKDETGKRVVVPKYFYGYKAHASLNAEAGMITSVVVTPGNAHDGKQFPTLVERDQEQGLPTEIYSADRAYDDTDNHYRLAEAGLGSSLTLNAYRTQKKDGNKGVWERLLESEAYQAGQRERYKIERKFGEAKAYHGLDRCRYVGRNRYAIQAYLTAMVLNLKRMVWVLTGTSFRGRATLAG
jgi:IS5 family transposase